MKKVVLAGLISIIIIILTLTIMPFALNADIEWKSHTENYNPPAGGGTFNWTNPNGENINFLNIFAYWIATPNLTESHFFTHDETVGSVAVTGLGTPTVSIYVAPGKSGWMLVNEYRWGQSVRTSELVCYRVWINEDDNFQFSFWYPYADNNWVRIYDMAGNMIYEADMPYDNPNLIVDLPDGMYTVKTFHDQPDPIQEFMIGKS